MQVTLVIILLLLFIIILFSLSVFEVALRQSIQEDGLGCAYAQTPIKMLQSCVIHGGGGGGGDPLFGLLQSSMGLVIVY